MDYFLEEIQGHYDQISITDLFKRGYPNLWTLNEIQPHNALSFLLN